MFRDNRERAVGPAEGTSREATPCLELFRLSHHKVQQGENEIGKPIENRGPFIRAIESLPERFMLLRREDSK